MSKRKLYEIVWNSPDFEHLYILPADHATSPWKLDFFLYPPPGQGWVKVKDNLEQYSLDIVYQHQVYVAPIRRYQVIAIFVTNCISSLVVMSIRSISKMNVYQINIKDEMT